jgi:hypothetical protein
MKCSNILNTGYDSWTFGAAEPNSRSAFSYAGICCTQKIYVRLGAFSPRKITISTPAMARIKVGK